MTILSGSTSGHVPTVLVSVLQAALWAGMRRDGGAVGLTSLKQNRFGLSGVISLAQPGLMV